MKPILEFLCQDRPAAVLVVVLSVTAAISERLALLAAISAILDRHDSPATKVGFAVAACIAALVFLATCHAAFGRGMKMAEAACDKLLLDAAKHVQNAELRSVELLGGENLLNRISRDTSALLEGSWSALLCLFLVSSLAVPIVYIFYESAFSMVLLTIVGVASWPLLRYLHAAQVVREEGAAVADVRFLRLAEQLTSGFLWLKLDRRRQKDLCDNHLWPSMEAVRRANVSAGKAYAANIVVIDLLVMLGIAAIPYITPFDGMRSVAVKVMALLLSAYGAFAEVLAVFPGLIAAAGSIERMRQLNSQLVSAALPVRAVPLRTFNIIEYDNISFEYRSNEGTQLFRFGPVTLQVAKGEILFVVGGNGSGKSTLTKLLTGLYAPMSGTIRVNGRPTAPASLRGLFGGVMSDYHLFDRCYGLEAIDERTASRLLEEFGLARVTSLRDGRFSTRDLSTGQRKRLALVIAVLEARPILLYDEWAADQDPEFRDLFYRDVLPSQRSRGTTVIAVTHDDRYFDCADRLIQIDAGRIAAVRTRQTAP